MRKTALKVSLDRLRPGTNLPGTVLVLMLQQVFNSLLKGLFTGIQSSYHVQATQDLASRVSVTGQRRKLSPTTIFSL